MCVNDLVVQGAEPLFFLDYYATGKLNVDEAAIVIEGIARACKESGCALIGGETAEMPGLYAKGDFDLAGFHRRRGGARPRPAQDARHAAQAMCVIGVASSGVHSNGYSLVRRVVADAGARYDAPAPFDAVATAGRSAADADAALCKERARGDPRRRREGSRAYHRRRHHRKSAARPARGSGCRDRSRPAGRRRRCSAGWRDQAGIAEREMLRTFNCGIGLIAVVAPESAGHVIDAFQESGDKAMRIGTLVAGDGEAKVVYRGRAEALTKTVRTAVLISGRGSNLAALIDACRDPDFPAEIVLVISNVEDGGRT